VGRLSVCVPLDFPDILGHVSNHGMVAFHYCIIFP
jgi:hypothetical protein